MLASKKAQLRWQCRRGMLELDLILNHFIDTQAQGLTEAEVACLDVLLATPDPILYAWLIGTDVPADEELASLVVSIQNTNSSR